MAKNFFSRDEKSQKVLCIHAEEKSALARSEHDATELAALAETLGYTVVRTMTIPLTRINPRHYIGSGYLETLTELVADNAIDLVLFDNELSPSQITNLEEAIKAGVMTRTETILEIFSMRAKTQIAKLQVELAILEFEYPRLRGKWSHFGRIVGGAAGMGVKGMGETQLEVDRRRARERMHIIRRELDRLARSKSVGRKSRANAFRIALAGYTNAGKSSLFNALTRERMHVEDKLFATLDAFTRKLFLSPKVRLDVLLSDTVGFIANLPHALVESFNSTLAEVREADVIIHVMDASKETMDDDAESVYTTLTEIGGVTARQIVVVNKIDLADEYARAALARTYPEALFVSAKSGEGLPALRDTLTVLALEKQAVVYPHSTIDYDEVDRIPEEI